MDARMLWLLILEDASVQWLDRYYEYVCPETVESKEQSKTFIKRVLRRIYARFPEAERKLQVKHLQWFLTRELAECTASTRYRNWLEIRFFCRLIRKDKDWLPHLKGPWTHRSGLKESERPPPYRGGRKGRRTTAQKLEENQAAAAGGGAMKRRRAKRKRRGNDEIKGQLRGK